jgi:hypothetical protein
MITVKIKGLVGDESTDFSKADQAAAAAVPGTTPAEIRRLRKSGEKYTWHHAEDGETMLLVPYPIHSIFPHTGGAANIRNQ